MQLQNVKMSFQQRNALEGVEHGVKCWQMAVQIFRGAVKVVDLATRDLSDQSNQEGRETTRICSCSKRTWLEFD